MPGFNAASSLDDYDFDLTEVNGPKGRIPLPSTEDVRKFREQVYAAETAATGIDIDNVTTEDEAVAYNTRRALLTTADRDSIYTGNLEAVIEICKDSPTREQIEALPMPVQSDFVEHVIGLLRPLF